MIHKNILVRWYYIHRGIKILQNLNVNFLPNLICTPAGKCKSTYTFSVFSLQNSKNFWSVGVFQLFEGSVLVSVSNSGKTFRHCLQILQSQMLGFSVTVLTIFIQIRHIKLTVTLSGLEIDDYAKDGGPWEVRLLCSFYHEPLRT